MNNASTRNFNNLSLMHFALTLFLLQAAPAYAESCNQTQASQQGRPTIGLVLGGGGARGAAHVGVLKVLEELNIPIDCIAGTSMGAIVGGLYAIGMSPEQIEAELVNIDWDAMFKDAPERPDRPFRRKRDDDTYLIKKNAGIKDGKIDFPIGYIHGQKFDLKLNELIQSVAEIKDFDDFSIPFRAVATDLETGQEVVLKSGNLATSIRASMSLPGVFDVVQIDGKILVDGYVANNVPISVARSMGAERVIAVNVGTPLLAREEITSLFSVVQQVSTILSSRNVKEQIKSLTERDILIEPDLGDFSTSDFKDALTAIQIGNEAATRQKSQLAQFSIQREQYSEFVSENAAQSYESPVIEFIEFNNESAIGEDVLREKFKGLIGRQLDTKAVDAAIQDVYGYDIFKSVRYELAKKDGQHGLIVTLVEKNWGPSYVQTGIALATDLNGEASWNIGASVLQNPINSRAGEIRYALQIGDSPLVGLDYFQPIDVKLNYFINTRLFLESQNTNRFFNEDALEQYQVWSYGVDAAAGRFFGKNTEVRAGLRRYTGSIDLQIGNPTTAIPNDNYDSAEAYFRLSYDSLDNVNWPTRGLAGSWEWLESVESLGAEDDFTQSQLGVFGVKSWRKNTLASRIQYNTTVSGTAPLQNLFISGGFLSLSGFTQDQLSGEDLLLLSSAFYRQMNNIDWLPFYLGASLEYGNVFQSTDSISLSPDKSILAGSLFVGTDTVLGPLYLGYGHAEGGNDSVYLYLGRLF